MNYEDIIAFSEANKHNFGMTPEAIARRQELIRRVAQHNPEVAMDMAKGPLSGVGGQPGSTATPTEAWSRGVNNTSVSEQVRGQGGYAPPAGGQGPIGAPPGAGYQRSAPMGEPTPSATGPIVPSIPNSPTYNQPGMQSGGSFGAPPPGQGYQRAQPVGSPIVNVHVGGPSALWSGQPGAMQSTDYPFSPRYGVDPGPAVPGSYAPQQGPPAQPPTQAGSFFDPGLTFESYAGLNPQSAAVPGLQAGYNSALGGMLPQGGQMWRGQPGPMQNRDYPFSPNYGRDPGPAVPGWQQYMR